MALRCSFVNAFGEEIMIGDHVIDEYCNKMVYMYKTPRYWYFKNAGDTRLIAYTHVNYFRLLKTHKLYIKNGRTGNRN